MRTFEGTAEPQPANRMPTVLFEAAAHWSRSDLETVLDAFPGVCKVCRDSPAWRSPVLIAGAEIVMADQWIC